MQSELPLLTCPYCGSPAKFAPATGHGGGHLNGGGTYTYRFDRWVCGKFPLCDAYVGVHKGTRTALGTLANAKLRDLRKEAHRLFDSLWVRKMVRERLNKGHSRRLAYAWLSAQMSLAPEKCHIAMFNETQCEQAISICRPYERKRA